MPRLQLFYLAWIIPILFVGQAVYVWRRRQRRPALMGRWVVALLLAGAWGTQVPSFFLDSVSQTTIGFPWRAGASYALPLLTLALLGCTVVYLATAPAEGRLAFALGLGLLAGAIMLDPALWPYHLGPFKLGGQTVTQFDLWAAIWGASWVLPVLGAWILTRQTYQRIPESSYRNRINFWALSLLVFFGAGLPAMIKDPGQPLWAILGATLLFGAALVGTTTLLGQNLPDFRLTLRQLLRRGIILVIILALAWIGLWFLVRTGTGRRLLDSDLGLAAAAVLATLGFLLVQPLLSWFTRHLFLPAAVAPAPIAEAADWWTILDQPAAFADHHLQQIQDHLQISDAWLAFANVDEQGNITLTPSLNHGHGDFTTAIVASESALLAHWRAQSGPLVSYDVGHEGSLSNLSAPDQALIDSWRCELLLPLLVGPNLVGLIGLGARADDSTYSHQDLAWLANRAGEIGPSLAQARMIAALQDTEAALRAENQDMAVALRLLKETQTLYQQCLNLVTPDFRQPIRQLDERWQQHIAELPARLEQPYTDLSPIIGEMSRIINRLVQVIIRVQQHSAFNLQPVQIVDLCRQAIDNLSTMAQSRRVEVNFLAGSRLPLVTGDPLRLQEAIQYILHNAIKFNKIGGSVDVACLLEADLLCLRISDTGVGIPEDRLATIWSGLDEGSLDQQRIGLGLPLTRYILRAHGGSATIDSKYGAGSTCTLTLPLAQTR